MESKLDSKVTLYNSENKRVGETFSRRARQLVKQQRAVWTDDTHSAIRFFPDAVEDWETTETHPITEEATYNKEDAALYALAQKRLSTRRRLFWHTIALIPGFLLLVVFADGAFRWNSVEMGFFMGLTFTLWGGLFVYHIHQFIKFNKGFFPFALSEQRRARKLAEEVEQLKRMGY